MTFSRKVRSMLRETSYKTTFKTRLDPDSQSAEAWLTTAGGGYVAAGVGGGITGKGAHVLVIDDPVKNREDAESQNNREKVLDGQDCGRDFKLWEPWLRNYTGLGVLSNLSGNERGTS